jgi:hypothetical protein
MLMMASKNELTLRDGTKAIEWEALVWIVGLAVVALGNPDNPRHFTLFPPTLLFGIRSPGYNLGHSISLLFHGRIGESIQANLLGIPAVLILSFRIVQLSGKTVSNLKKLFKGDKND